MNIPSIYYTSNTAEVQIGGLRLYYSYTTLVAFHHSSTGLVCRENEWSVTTGKYLNSIEPDKKKRVSGEEMYKRLREVIEGL